MVFLESDAVFRRTSVGGVAFNVPSVMKWRSKNGPKILPVYVSPGVLMYGGGVI